MGARLIWFLTWWLRRPLLWWVRTQVSPSRLAEELKLDPNIPVCYVLPTRSQVDRWVLQDVAARNELPKPRSRTSRLPSAEGSACLYLPALLDDSEGLQALFGQALKDDEFDMQLVPVSLFWGRDPGKETSLLRILFSDAENPGYLRKLFIVFANGRNTVMNFGAPIRFRAFVGRSTEYDKVVHKLVRVLRVHFRRQRNATIGPSLSTRGGMVRSVLANPQVGDAIESQTRETGQSRERVEQQAREMVEEIAADYSVTTLNFLDRVLTWVWNRIFDGLEVHRIERARAAAAEGGVLYLPSHRSHMDYLLLSYVLYHEGLVPPHIAAGINLNFWPVGRILRRGGAFFLRRSFSGDKLYTVVFRAYVDVLVSRGYPVSLYPEGGRSRTGRLLQPKTGMLAMVAASHLRHASKPLTIIPVFIGYDQVMEVNAYFKELRGKHRKKESVFELLRARKILRRKYGKAYLSFGEPIRLRDYVNELRPQWSQWNPGPEADDKPPGFDDFVRGLAREVMIRINSAVVLTPTGLAGLALLATPQRALAEDELGDLLDRWLDLQRHHPYSDDRICPADSGRELVLQAEPIAALTRTPHPWGDLMLADGRPGVLLTYTRNTIAHAFALPSILANFFRPGQLLARDRVITAASALYPFVQAELFLRHDADRVDQRLQALLDEMLRRGLLQLSGEQLRAPPVSTPEFSALAGLARILRETLERYAMTSQLLAGRINEGTIDRKAFVEECRLMAERVAILSGRDAPEFFDPALFRGFLATLTAKGLLTPVPAEGLEPGDERLRLAPELAELADSSLSLLGQDMGQMILQLVSRSPRVVAPTS